MGGGVSKGGHSDCELIQALKQKGYTQANLAKRLGVSQGLIAHWKTGRSPVPEHHRQKLEHLLGSRKDARPLEDAEGRDYEDSNEAESANSRTVFEVPGPIAIPAQHKGGGWHLFDGKKAQNQFWKKDQHSHFKKRRGVYICAIKTSKGITPLYVGKATKGFGQECFTDRNQLNYTRGLARYKEGTPVMFFILYPKKQGQTNSKAIGELEVRLIHLAEIKNRFLVNRNDRTKKWSVEGILGDKQGQQTSASKTLRNALGLAGEAEDNSE